MGRATPVGNAKTCRLPGLYTGTRGTSTGRAAKSRVGTGLPRASRPGNGQASVPGWSSFAGGVPSQYLGLAASRWLLAFFPIELVAVTLPCSHFLPLSSYHHAPSPHRPAHSRVPGCTKMHLSCQGSPSEDPFLRCPVLCCLVLRCSFRVAVVAQSTYATRLCSREAKPLPAKSDADPDTPVAAAVVGRLSGTSPRRVE